jgi:hypothetical protein
MKSNPFLLILIFVTACVSPSRDSNKRKYVYDDNVVMDSVLLDTMELLEPSNEVVNLNLECLNLFDSIDVNFLKKISYEKSTSTVLSARDFGISTRKVGQYVLFYVYEEREVRYLGDLVVTYGEKPWYRFSDDEYWFSLKIVDSGFKISELIYVGGSFDSLLSVYNFIETDGNTYNLVSSCYNLKIVVDDSNRITEILLQRAPK